MIQLKMNKEAFYTFARLHTHEAYDLNPDLFCEFLRDEGYTMTNEEIKQLIEETR